MKRTPSWRALTIVTAAALMFTACTSETAETTDDDTEPQAQDVLRIGAIPGWSDHTGIAYIYEHVLEDNGYVVDVESTVDVGPAYEAVAEGEFDLYGAAWPERTQATYWEDHQDTIQDLGVIYGGAEVFLAVPEYSEISSIEELPEFAEELDGDITGIESGAGLSVLTEEEVMPHYGLDQEFELQLSSAGGMLGELEEAIENDEEIVVTMWTPNWVYEQFNLQALEDPDQVYGESESIHTLGRPGFAEDFPEVANMIENFSLTIEQVADLENYLANESGDDEDDSAAVAAWLEENPEVVEQLTDALNG